MSRSSSTPKPAGPPYHVVLVSPAIPQNTGNIGRLCAYTGCRLHLIHPLGFQIDDRHLRRAGMDYWRSLDVVQHADWQAFIASPLAPARLYLFTTKASTSFWNAQFLPGDGLVFGSEPSGAPGWLHEWVGEERRLRIDSSDGSDAALRSLNLSSSVAIATYEALRQARCLQNPRTRA